MHDVTKHTPRLHRAAHLARLLATSVTAAMLLVAVPALAQHAGHEHGGAHKGSHAEADTSKAGPMHVYMCPDHPDVGLSYPGKCPMDGKALVEKKLDTTKLQDLGNDSCPIRGKQTKESVFAVYKGKMVHFCCKGCEKKFFKDPETHIRKLERGDKDHSSL